MTRDRSDFVLVGGIIAICTLSGLVGRNDGYRKGKRDADHYYVSQCNVTGYGSGVCPNKTFIPVLYEVHLRDVEPNLSTGILSTDTGILSTDAIVMSDNNFVTTTTARCVLDMRGRFSCPRYPGLERYVRGRNSIIKAQKAKLAKCESEGK